MAPDNNYVVAQTEWADNRSNMLYTPRGEVTETMLPILIEVQYLVDQEFMLRLIRDASSAYGRYRVLHSCSCFRYQRVFRCCIQKIIYRQ
jgi:hypothetical protein